MKDHKMMDRDVVQMSALRILKLFKQMVHVKDVLNFQNLLKEEESVVLKPVMIVRNFLKMEHARTAPIIIKHRPVEKNVFKDCALMIHKNLIQIYHVKLVLKIKSYLRVEQSVSLLLNKVVLNLKDYRMMEKDVVQMYVVQNFKLFKQMAHVKSVQFFQNHLKEKESVELTNVMVVKKLLKMELAKIVLIIMGHHLVEKNVS